MVDVRSELIGDRARATGVFGESEANDDSRCHNDFDNNIAASADDVMSEPPR